MSRSSREKGARIEREVVELHRGLGLKAERVPLSGATRYQGNGADVDVYPFGPDAAPLVCEVKARGDGGGFAMLERWLGENDALFLRRDRAEPLVMLPWRTWARLVGKRAAGRAGTRVAAGLVDAPSHHQDARHAAEHGGGTASERDTEAMETRR